MPDYDIKMIGHRIKIRREELDMTLDEIANATNVAKSTIQRYEKGLIERPKIPVLHSISSVLGVNPDWLLCISNQKESEDAWNWDSSYLKELRENNNYTQEKLAEKLGIPVSRYKAIEDAVILPTIPLLCNMAITLCTSVDLLLQLELPYDNPQVLSEEEKLLNIYRHVNSKGKAQIMKQAEYTLQDKDFIFPITQNASAESAG